MTSTTNQAPIITRIKSIELITDGAVYGTLYHNVLLPLIHGTVSIPNRNTFSVDYNEKKYIIRLDMPCSSVNPFKRVVDTEGDGQARSVMKTNDEYMVEHRLVITEIIEDMRKRFGLLHDAGSGIFKDIVDVNDLNLALTTCNSFRRQGVGIVSKLVSDDGDGHMEYKVTSDFDKHSFTTADVDEMLFFLGTLARVYTLRNSRS